MTSQCFFLISSSDCITKSRDAPGTLYSYGPLRTTGVLPPKLSCGGGVAVIHSKVVASHGLSLAFFPFHMLQKRLNRKMNWLAMVINAAMLMNTWMGVNALIHATSVPWE